MPIFKRKYERKEGRFKIWFMGLLAGAVFAFPTAMLIWLLVNRELALYGSSNAFIYTNGFWLIIAFFILIATVFPRFFPSLLGKIWKFIIEYERF